MTSAHRSISDSDAERLLASLEGIVSAHVVTDNRGRITEIHVLSAADLHPKQVVRNVESALSAGLGVEIDRRVVSVAQIRTADDEGDDAPDDVEDHADTSAAAVQENGTVGPGPAVRNGALTTPAASSDALPGASGEGARLEYVRFASRRDAEMCACEVTLRDADREVIGTGSGPDTAAGRAEAAARAVLAAIEQARDEVRLQLEGAVISTSRGRSYVIVSAQAVLHRGTVPLAGAAPLARSPEEAGILAALQATNRWSG